MRGAGMAALALAVTVTLSGCATLVGNVIVQNAASNALHKKDAAEAKKDKGKPAKGDCWVSTVSYSNYAVWSTRKPVSCDKPHQLYTFAVLPLVSHHSG